MTSNGSESVINSSNGDGGSWQAATFDWDLLIEGQVIATHDYGVLLLLPVSGLLISLFNPAMILCVASGTALFSFVLFPAATRALGFAGAMLTRFCLGVSHAFTSPSLDASISRWMSKSYVSTVYALVSCSSQLSIIVGNPLIAVLCGARLFGGWPAVFYIVFLLGQCWLTLFALFYWFQLRSGQDQEQKHKHFVDGSEPRPGWSYGCRSVFNELARRPAFWALLPNSMSATCTVRLFSFYIPIYFHDVLDLPLMDNALYTTLPFFMFIFGKVFFGSVSDLIVRRKLLDRSRCSKIFNSVAYVGTGTCILILGLTATLYRQAIVAILTLGLTVNAASVPGYQTSIVSMNKKWTGVISAVCVLAAMISGILLPVLISSVVIRRVASEWRVVFCCVAGLNFFSAIIYALFGYIDSSA